MARKGRQFKMNGVTNDKRGNIGCPSPDEMLQWGDEDPFFEKTYYANEPGYMDDDDW